VTQCGCGRGGFFEGCRRREDGDRVPRSPSGGSGRGKPGNATNLMTGNGMQQARGRLRGANRRGGARPRGRNRSRRVAPSARREASSSMCVSSSSEDGAPSSTRTGSGHAFEAVRWRGTNEPQKGRSAALSSARGAPADLRARWTRRESQEGGIPLFRQQDRFIWSSSKGPIGDDRRPWRTAGKANDLRPDEMGRRTTTIERC